MKLYYTYVRVFITSISRPKKRKPLRVKCIKRFHCKESFGEVCVIIREGEKTGPRNDREVCVTCPRSRGLITVSFLLYGWGFTYPCRMKL